MNVLLIACDEKQKRKTRIKIIKEMAGTKERALANSIGAHAPGMRVRGPGRLENGIAALTATVALSVFGETIYNRIDGLFEHLFSLGVGRNGSGLCGQNVG